MSVSTDLTGNTVDSTCLVDHIDHDWEREGKSGPLVCKQCGEKKADPEFLEHYIRPELMDAYRWRVFQRLVANASLGDLGQEGNVVGLSLSIVDTARHIRALLADNLRLMQQNEAYRLELEPLRQRYFYLERDSNPYIEAREGKEREEKLRRLGWRPKPWWRRWLQK